MTERRRNAFWIPWNKSGRNYNVDITSLLFSILPMLIFCLALAAVTAGIRRIVAYASASFAASHLWKNLLLPILPVALGAVIAMLATKLPVPEGFESTSGRVSLGAVAGLFSAAVYRWVKAAINAKIKDQHDCKDDCKEHV